MSETQEAMVLSQATSQAITAARSIMLAGGSENTALSTAKAAAQSILVPFATDQETGPSTLHFMGRRKARRQAEIVASMALLSVKNSIQMQTPNQFSGQWYEPNMPVRHRSIPPPPVNAYTNDTASYNRNNSSISSHSNYFSEKPPTPHDFSDKSIPRPPLSPHKRRCHTPASHPPPRPVPELERPRSSRSRHSPRIDEYHDEVESVQSSHHLSPRVADHLTMARTTSRTRDLAAECPNEDPIYYNDGPKVANRPRSIPARDNVQYSYSSDSMGETFTYDSATYATVDVLSNSRDEGALGHGHNDGGGFMSSLAKVFSCGYIDDSVDHGAYSENREVEENRSLMADEEASVSEAETREPPGVTNNNSLADPNSPMSNEPPATAMFKEMTPSMDSQEVSRLTEMTMIEQDKALSRDGHRLPPSGPLTHRSVRSAPPSMQKDLGAPPSQSKPSRIATKRPFEPHRFRKHENYVHQHHQQPQPPQQSTTPESTPDPVSKSRESMEEVVLRAITKSGSARSNRQVEQSGSNVSATDRISVSRRSEDHLSGVRHHDHLSPSNTHETADLIESPHDSAIQRESVWSRKARFKKWVLKRKQKAATEFE
jgi:hypothetical protein